MRDSVSTGVAGAAGDGVVLGSFLQKAAPRQGCSSYVLERYSQLLMVLTRFVAANRYLTTFVRVKSVELER